MSFPYEQRFRRYLQNYQLLKPATKDDICHDVNDLFIYLRNFSETYRHTADLSVLEGSDVSEYLIMLQTKRMIKNTTYNKVLTHLNTYFKFLFKNKLSSSLPTVSLKGLHRPAGELKDLYGWEKRLNSYLGMSELSNYTKMVLLLLAHFYTITEIIAPGFYQVLAREDWSEPEQEFIAKFQREQEPVQKMQNCPDLFLKQRVDFAAPQLSLAGLHKILKKDQPKCELPLSPRKLHQSVIISFLHDNQGKTDGQLCSLLHLDLSSLNYYRTVFSKQDES